MNERVVLVTGGAGNLGRAVTRAFLEAGAYVAVPFYKTDAPDAVQSLRNEFGERLLIFAFDLTTERGAQEAVREVVDWRGGLDTVAHLVGGYRGGVRLADTPVEVWDRMMDLNLKSAWLVSRAAIPVMLKDGGGSFVFVSARAARKDRAGHSAYAISKAAVLTLVEAIAEEYGGEGIRANAVLPGMLDTPDNRTSMPDADSVSWTDPADVARTILFLSSPESVAINGASVPVYGRS
jgi:NAD(P)-dependent dehydrogenase (short-subunit alcohol dehydrogenase family)